MTVRRKTRVVVGLSGGVDSSVAALLLRRQGYEVHAVFMKNWEDSYEAGYCTAAQDLEDAREVCETLDIPLHTVSFAREYRERVFAYFLQELQRGRTPNPDVLCNREIKFAAFPEHARRLGARHIATGHYARLERAGHDGWRLLKGVDPGKDQSYFLHALNQAQLGAALFPLGELHKDRVRELAAEAGLVTHDKKDSTGICFIGERPFRDFLGRHLPTRPGEIRTPAGTVVGEHAGLAQYTLGQRQGLGIGGRRGDAGAPWFVVDKDLEHNALVVVQGTDHPALHHRCLRASALSWIAGTPPPTPLPCAARIRYRQPDEPCTLMGIRGGVALVRFDRPQRAVTPGQFVVFYQGARCLGGGVIDAALNELPTASHEQD